MTASQLTGRELDRAVAEAMGFTNVRESGIQPWRMVGRGPDGDTGTLPAHSAPDCSGLGPVLAWLTEGVTLAVTFEWDGYSKTFRAMIGANHETWCWADGPDLPTAACRLLVAWANRKGQP